MTKEEQLLVDMQSIEQIVLNPSWSVIVRRIEEAISIYSSSLLVCPMADVERLRQKVIAYKELLKLPEDISDQFKEMKAQNISEQE